MRIIEWVLGLLIAAMIACLIGMVYNIATAETISIRKDSFSCTQSHKQMHLQLVGKVNVPIWDNICDVYTRK